jgi:uncharacterized protein
MENALSLVKRHPLISFFVLAYALTWPVIPLVSVSPLLGLPALFGPALAAIIVAYLVDGKSALKDLLSRLVRWRVEARWYVLALGLPAILALAVAGLNLLLGAPTAIRFGGLSVLNFVVFVFVVGEELGWRGYALPRLLARKSALAASLILGVLWGAWHLPTFFVPGALVRFIVLCVRDPDGGLLYSVHVGLHPYKGERADLHPAARLYQPLPGHLHRRGGPS